MTFICIFSFFSCECHTFLLPLCQISFFKMKRFLLLYVAFFIAVTAKSQSASRQEWDIHLTPFAGVAISTLTEVDGKTTFSPTVGGLLELSISDKFGVDFELSAYQSGAKKAKDLRLEQGEAIDYKAWYYSSSYFVRYYPAKWLSFYSGLHLKRIFSAKANDVKIKTEIHKGDVAIPLGLTLHLKDFCINGRYNFTFRKWAKTDEAIQMMGNARWNHIEVSLGYSIQLF